MKTLIFITALIILFMLLCGVLSDIINNIIIEFKNFIIEIKDVNSGSYNWEVRDRNKCKKN